MSERYQSIARRILSDIESGLYRKGELLPTRTELSLRFKVARATLDRAVTLLVRRGILESSRGSGTLVSMGGRNYQIALVGAPSNILHSKSASKRCQIELIPITTLASKSERSVLRRFDGIVWGYPEKQQLSWSRELPDSIPQIIVNRDVDGFNYVSTDHRGAIQSITSERLALCPDGLPVFLCKAGTSGIVWTKRQEGFVDACRDASRFYEVIKLPSSFAGCIAAFEKRFPSPLSQPLIMVSGFLAATGSVMTWARGRRFAWSKDIFYSDFDNEYPEDVWGIRCTSFVQDYDNLLDEAVVRLLEIIDKKISSAKVLVPPRRINGDT